MELTTYQLNESYRKFFGYKPKLSESKHIVNLFSNGANAIHKNWNTQINEYSDLMKKLISLSTAAELFKNEGFDNDIAKKYFEFSNSYINAIIDNDLNLGFSILIEIIDFYMSIPKIS